MALILFNKLFILRFQNLLFSATLFRDAKRISGKFLKYNDLQGELVVNNFTSFITPSHLAIHTKPLNNYNAVFENCINYLNQLWK